MPLPEPLVELGQGEHSPVALHPVMELRVQPSPKILVALPAPFIAVERLDAVGIGDRPVQNAARHIGSIRPSEQRFRIGVNSVIHRSTSQEIFSMTLAA
jgi:hypothetical protein